MPAQTIQPNNPANSTVEPKAQRKRIPMSTPVLRLEVPEIPGYHCHWIRDWAVPRALQASYQFVNFDEVPVNQRNPGTDASITGASNLSSQIRVAAGIGPDGNPEHLVLMKLPLELWIEDRKIIDDRNASVMNAIFRGEKIIGTEKDSNQDDTKLRYVDKERTKALFNRPTRKG